VLSVSSADIVKSPHRLSIARGSEIGSLSGSATVPNGQRGPGTRHQKWPALANREPPGPPGGSGLFGSAPLNSLLGRTSAPNVPVHHSARHHA
jgi:hypothetical protein